MTRAEYLFVIVWIINFIISVLYYLWGALFYVPARERQDKNEEEYLHDNRRTYLIRVIVMVLCPIVGPLFFLVSHLIYMTIFRQEVDLDDVIFSKERVKTNVKADEERERNLVPIEEALAVSDKKNLRMLMLNVIRGDLQDSLESISLALNSEDSETSHYAASVLRDELNDFRVTVQKACGTACSGTIWKPTAPHPRSCPSRTPPAATSTPWRQAAFCSVCCITAAACIWRPSTCSRTARARCSF